VDVNRPAAHALEHFHQIAFPLAPRNSANTQHKRKHHHNKNALAGFANGRVEARLVAQLQIVALPVVREVRAHAHEAVPETAWQQRRRRRRPKPKRRRRGGGGGTVSGRQPKSTPRANAEPKVTQPGLPLVPQDIATTTRTSSPLAQAPENG
jgi:hypothetical protein